MLLTDCQNSGLPFDNISSFMKVGDDDGSHLIAFRSHYICKRRFWMWWWWETVTQERTGMSSPPSLSIVQYPYSFLFFLPPSYRLFTKQRRERERHDNWKEFLWQHGAWRPIFINAWSHTSTRRIRAKRRSNSHHRRHAQSIHRWNKTVQWLTVASKRLPAGHRHTVATTTSAPATGPDGWSVCCPTALQIIQRTIGSACSNAMVARCRYMYPTVLVPHLVLSTP